MTILAILGGLRRLFKDLGLTTQIYGVPDLHQYPSAVIEIFRTYPVNNHAGSYYVYSALEGTSTLMKYGREYKTRIRIKLYSDELKELTKIRHRVLMYLSDSIKLDLSDRVIGQTYPEDGKKPQNIIETFDVGLTSSELEGVCEWNDIKDKRKARFDCVMGNTDSYSYQASGKTVWGEIISFDIYYIDSDNIVEINQELIQEINITLGATNV